MHFKIFFERKLLRKVPEITIIFWVIKLLTTALGESTSDFLVHNLDPIIAVLIGALVFSVAMTAQLWAKKYIAWIYWLAVTMVAVFGTMAADVVHIVLGVPYIFSAMFFAASLALVFALWRKKEKTLSIHSIFTPTREVYYWLTVVTTFALGTALGDMTAVTLHLGYLNSGFLFFILFIFPLILYKYFGVNEVFTFWTSYIMTRPLGASFADWFGRSPDLGGIGFGTDKTSIVLAIMIIIFVAYLTIYRIDLKRES